SYPVFWRNLREDAATAAVQVMLALMFLAYSAWRRTHAIGLTLVRLAFTRRRLLEWETAATTAAQSAAWVGRSGLRRFASEMIASPVVAVAVGLLIMITRPDGIASALPILLLWVLA